ncbi:hypothetical protein E3N88_15407 [Mikania micrantha]|uniref:Aminotransferase-like plant mobile domain-containing protein n=1 Tax=Mikania micrantha TaxID=192012 RepID=A0A5N6NWQ1_9ASTR|nr:hypothetical protein E3N88_15407 [Mikania micrantha]
MMMISKHHHPPKSTPKTGTSKSKFVEFDSTNRLRLRNPPKSLCEFHDIRTAEQKAAVDDIGFGRITPGLVYQTLGIPMGKLLLKEKKIPSLADTVVAEFRQQFKEINGIPTIKTITDLVKCSGDSERLFKINFLVAFNTIIAQMSQGPTANMTFFTSLKQGAYFKSFDWCSYIITCLNRTKDK